jgi:hypothetical protein
MTEEIKNKKNYLILIVSLLCLAIVSCQSYLDMVTPAVIPEKSMEYAEIDPNSLGFISLADAKDIRNTITIKHRNIQIGLIRMTNDDKVAFQDARDLITTNIEEAEYTQNLIVGSSENPFSVFGLLGPAGIGVFAGKLLKRKGDFSPEEVEKEKAKLA